MISDVDWSELFERISLVDDVLAAGSAFRDMDFATRNLYRSAIEELARGSDLHGARGRPTRAVQAAAHRMRAASVEAIAARIPAIICSPAAAALRGRHRLSAAFCDGPDALTATLGIGGYVGAGALVAAAAPRLAAVRAARSRPADWMWLGLLGVLGAVPAIDAAVALVNRGVTRGFGATPLPALELRGGVPAHLRTLVAVPTLLTTAEAIEEQIERLEIHHLASPEGELHFALLSDWLDAATRACRRRRGAAGDGGRRHRPAQSALRPGARRRPLPAAPSPAASGTRAKRVDRLGAQARQAARAEPRCCAARPTRPSSAIGGRPPTCPPASATSSRSTPTRGCRATRCAA